MRTGFTGYDCANAALKPAVHSEAHAARIRAFLFFIFSPDIKTKKLEMGR
jgi:hypothetical protein